MAAGKSLIGAALAQKLNYDFLDTDKAIERLKGKSVAEIFKSKGENYFRAEESKLLNLTTSIDNIVIATGGGLPMQNGHMKRMLSTGITVFLEVGIENLVHRLRQDNTRPLHQEQLNLTAEIQKRYKIRYPFYREAHLTIPNNGSLEETLEVLIQKLNLA